MARNLPYSFDVDATYYFAQYPDVAATGQPAARHYHIFGWREGRNPDDLFDTRGYLASNPDIAAAGIDPLAHFHRFGWMEGRQSSPAFDSQAYLAANPDVAAAGVDPLAHYLRFGRYEGREAIAKPLYDADDSANAVNNHAAAGTAAGVSFSWGGFVSPNLTYTLVGDSSGGGFAVDAATGRVTVADPSKIDYYGSGPLHSYTVTVQASDLGHTITQSATIAVGNPGTGNQANNFPPIFDSGATALTYENVSTDVPVYKAHATDADTSPNNTVHYGFGAGGADNDLFYIDPSTGDVTFKNSPDYESANHDNTYDIVVTATDGGSPAKSASQQVTISVQNVNEAPTATEDGYTANAGEPKSVDEQHGVLANDSDPDSGTILTASLDSTVSHGTLEFHQDGSFVYTPGPDFIGEDSFTYKASDGQLASDPVKVTIAVTEGTPPQEHAPTANNDDYSGNVGEPIFVDAKDGVLHNDTDPDSGTTLTAHIVSQPSHGGLTLYNDGSFDYFPDTTFSGKDTFTYTASDGTYSSSPATVSITLKPQEGVSLNLVGTHANEPLFGGTSADVFNFKCGEHIASGGGGADQFVFTAFYAKGQQSVQITDYASNIGDIIDVSAITKAFTASDGPAPVFQVQENDGGTGATLRVNTGSADAPHWAEIAKLDGLHAGDVVDVAADPADHAALMHLHVEAHGVGV